MRRNVLATRRPLRGAYLFNASARSDNASRLRDCFFDSIAQRVMCIGRYASARSVGSPISAPAKELRYALNATTARALG